MKLFSLIKCQGVLKSIPYHKRWVNHHTFQFKSQFNKPIKYLKASQLWKPFGFSVGVTLFSFSAATIIECERIRSSVVDNKEFIKKWISQSRKRHQQETSSSILGYFHNLTQFEKIFFVVCCLNVSICILWKIIPNKTILYKFLTLKPVTKPLFLPMIMSVFSHRSLIHCGINMYALYSFAQVANSQLGPEQLSALYLSAGAFSSFTSLAHKVLIGIPSLSIGASGAVISVMAVTCLTFPEGQVGIAFLPNLTVSAKTGLFLLIFVDTLGLILRWRFIDHAGHLGGSFFGVWYLNCGEDWLWNNRQHLVRKWYDLKKVFSN